MKWGTLAALLGALLIPVGPGLAEAERGRHRDGGPAYRGDRGHERGHVRHRAHHGQRRHPVRHHRHYRHRGHHHKHHRRPYVSFWLGAPYYYGWSPWWWHPYAYHYPYYHYETNVIVEEPPVYLERPPVDDTWWYYCEPAGAYYPDAETCPEPWLKVPPRAP